MTEKHPRRTALVIASAQGIGRATAVRLAEDGYDLSLVDTNEEKLAVVAAELRQKGASVETTIGDATNPVDVATAVENTMGAFGRIDALACIAGGAGGAPLHQVDDIPLEQWNHVIGLNLTSTYLACHYVVPQMRAQRYGRIACLSSTVARGRLGPVGTMGARLPYATAKAGLIGFVKQLAKDVGQFGITVNCVMPWLTFGEPGTKVRETFNALPEEYQKKTLALSPQGRPVAAAGVAAALHFLLSEDAGYVSGVAMPVDGAMLN